MLEKVRTAVHRAAVAAGRKALGERIREAANIVKNTPGVETTGDQGDFGR